MARAHARGGRILWSKARHFLYAPPMSARRAHPFGPSISSINGLAMRFASALIVISSFALVACQSKDDEEPDASEDGSIVEDCVKLPEFERDDRAPTPEEIAYCPRDAAEIRERVEDAIAGFSIEEKIKLMAGSGLLPVSRSWSTPSIGAMPGFRMIDGPRGVANTAQQNATAFPVAMMRAATFDPELERRVGVAIAKEIKAAGSDVLLAPTANILFHPRWGRAQETYGEDSFLMGALATAFIEGAQGEGVLATVKHYAVNSIENTRMDVDVSIDPRTLREIYLPHFKKAVQEGKVAAVMTAYNSVNGAYASENAPLLSILYDEWNFAGFTMSDWVFGTHNTQKAIEAGLDLEMPVGQIYGKQLSEAVCEGSVDPALIDRSLRRTIFAALCYGLDEIPNRGAVDRSELEKPETLALAREAARRGAVLLKNDSGTLPLNDDEARVALLGRLADRPNIGDTGSSRVITSEVITVRKALEERLGERLHFVDAAEAAAADEATAIGAANAIVLVVGLTDEDEGEFILGRGGDRTSLALRSDDLDLIARVRELAGAKPIIVILEGGAAFTVEEFVSDVEAIIMGFYSGARGGEALAELLFGDANFTGRLPFSVPIDEAKLPAFDNINHSVEYPVLHGYLALAPEDARYPFGYGLSYTEFSYSDRALIESDEELILRLSVTNLGTRDGIEIVQAYIEYPGGVLPRARRELKAFAVVAAEAGATEDVELRIALDDLRYYDVDAAEYRLEHGEYRVHLVRHAAESAEPPLAFTLP